MKKLLFIPLGWKSKPNQDFFRAFGEHYITMHHENMVDSLLFSPDYIYVQSGALESGLLMNLKIESGAMIMQWTGDCRPNELLPEVMMYKDIADITMLVVGVGQKEMYEKALGHRVEYLQQGVFDSFFLRPQTITDGKIIFIGNNYDQFEGAVERFELCKYLSIMYRQFEVIGNGFNLPEINNNCSIPYKESNFIYNRAYISISHPCFNGIEGYYSNRTLDIMASGGCCLMREFPNCNNYFTHMKDVVFYSDNVDAVKKIEMLIDNPDIRNSIAKEGHTLALKNHTFKSRVLQLKELSKIK